MKKKHEKNLTNKQIKKLNKNYNELHYINTKLHHIVIRITSYYNGLNLM